MKRGDFLKGLGLAGVSTLVPFSKSLAATLSNKPTTGCILVPTETAGPYPWDLSGDNTMFRTDIREGNAGTQLNLTINLVNVNDNCNPITNARVDIWHCNKDGYYSEYANQPGYLGTQSHVGESFFRGIQLSDSAGQVKFTTIYPGWYTSRVTHIHAQIFISSLLAATTQFAFPDSLNNSIFSTDANYTAHGVNTSVVNNAADNVFSDSSNTVYEMLTIAANTSGGYDASITIGVAVPATGIIKLTPDTGGQFVLNQNIPNPFSENTVIEFTLNQASKVWLDVYDLMGKKICTKINEQLGIGNHSVSFNRIVSGKSLPAGNYAYQLNVENNDGLYRQIKVMTVV